ncbi:amidohydrolase family protein [Mycobacterium vicinigordonae]|uniref:Amidohydrolase n=1 Tax=Mycobacterium vicinigordonae TaxID=1719132 RepID=A0A7D6E8F5_9MYCO|nr:amidohydrolase family protein [Mycobacterium vicinigordonae]QLL07405.1 amidohydrolase [Mycobacterium vicinigordonae]
MRTDDMILISVDDHVIEPANMFDGHMPAKYADRAPRVVRNEHGVQSWVFEGQETFNIGMNAVVGRPREEFSVEPASFDDMRRACWDVHERVRDMSANGVLAGVPFPSFPRFCGQFFAGADDKDLALATVRAYNDWMIGDWCGPYPERFVPLAIPPYWDPEAAAAEVHRVSELGCHAMTFSENPYKLGQPSLHSEHWNPLWQACSDTGTTVCMHIGSSSQLLVTAPDAAAHVTLVLAPVIAVLTAADLLFSHVLRKFPDLRFALSEGGIGWVPYFAERADYAHRQHTWIDDGFESSMPSEVFRKQVYTCFIEDHAGVAQRDRIGVESIMWECDYPHSDSTWPNSPESAARSLAGCTDAEVDAITHLNAMRLFSFDPFSHRPRERCTVGALRAEAHDVDVTPRSIGEKAKGAISSSDLFSKVLPNQTLTTS